MIQEQLKFTYTFCETLYQTYNHHGNSATLVPTQNFSVPTFVPFFYSSSWVFKCTKKSCVFKCSFFLTNITEKI